MINLDKVFVKAMKPPGFVATCSSAGVATHMLGIYERLWRLGSSRDLFLFPVGTIMLPSSTQSATSVWVESFVKALTEKCHRDIVVDAESHPLILFDKLEGWFDDKKPPLECRGNYLLKINAAIDALNEAGIAHIDLSGSAGVGIRVAPG
ncbi:MAG: hypothetical protein B7Z16_17160, partial [Algoriphagus sp. 32-45-6]